MKKILTIAALLFVIVFSGCETDLFEKKIDGKYEGFFERTSSGLPASQVTLEFDNGSFSGSSNVANYPAICNGTYDVEGKSLKVRNACFFTANFDWTLIFNNDYQLEMEGRSLTITREYGNGVSDVYRLTRID
jgi:hypothetical protein